MNSLGTRSKVLAHLTIQKRILENTIDMIGEIYLDHDIILDISDNYISYGTNVEFRTFGNVKHVVCPIHFNKTSLRCQILAHEYVTSFFKKLKSNSGETYIRSIPYDIIYGWVNIEPDDVPLLYPWKFLSDDFKKKYFET